MSGEKFPPCVKNILFECGYDRMLTLQEIDEPKLRRLEKHVNENLIEHFLTFRSVLKPIF